MDREEKTGHAYQMMKVLMHSRNPMRESALSKSIDAFSPITVEKSNSVLAIKHLDQNNQQLIWVTKISGTSKDFVKTGGQVIIDAHAKTL